MSTSDDTNPTAPEAGEEPTEEREDSTEDASDDDDSDDWRQNFDAQKAMARIEKVQRHNRNLRERAAAAEKKAEGVDEKEQRISSLEAELLRERVGRRLNLPDELVDRLRGNSEDEILADAEKLVAIVGKPSVNGRKPAERLRGGGEPDAEPEPDLRKIAADIPRR